MIIYPDKPWYDGQEFEHITSEGQKLVGTYDEAHKTWFFRDFRLASDLVFTDTVYTVNMKPAAESIAAAKAIFDSRLDLPSPDQFTTQQDVNWYLHELIEDVEGGSNLWDDVLNPPTDNLGEPLFKFWWKPDENELYYWNTQNFEWVLTGLQEFDRGVIMSTTPPTSHPKFIGTDKEDLVDGDIWVNDSDPAKYQLNIYDHDNLHWVPAGDGQRPPIFSPTEPTFHPDFPPTANDLVAGDTWYDTSDPDELISHIYDGNDWLAIGGEYVRRKGGDSMQGPLSITGGRNPDANGLESTIKTLNVDSGQSSSLNLKWKGGTKVYIGDEQTILTNDLKFNISGKSIYAENNKKGLTVNSNGVFYEGNYTVDKHLATKKNVEEAVFNDPLDLDSNKFVKVNGDTMTGDLEMKGKRIVFNDIPADGQVIRANRNAGEDVDLLYLAHSGGSQQGFYDVRMTGNTSYNGIRFKGGSGGDVPIFEMRANAQSNTFFGDLKFDGNRIRELGDAVDDTDAAPYGQIKRELSAKFNEYVDTISFGSYTYTVSNNPQQGFFAAYTTNGGQTEHTPANIKQLWISKTNKAGDDVGLDTLSPGDLIRFAEGTDLYQFRVNGTPDDQGSWLKINVNKGVGPSDLPVNDEFDISLIKLTGGSVNLDDYLKLDSSNSPLTGNLEINQGLSNTEASLKLTGNRPNTTNSAATIGFENTNSTDIGYLTYRAFGSEHYFRFNRDVDLNNNGLHSVARIRMQAGGSIQSGNNPRLLFKNASNGNEGQGLLEVPRPDDTRRGFAVRGNHTDGNEIDILYSYTNASGGDAVNYRGKMDSDTNLVNLGKVKEIIANGTGAGEVIQTHGPWLYKPAGSSVAPGEWTTDIQAPRKVRQITFHNKDGNNENVDWGDLQQGEVITIVQRGDFSGVGGPTDAWSMINYEVTDFQTFSTATVVDVNCHWTYVVFSTGQVQYNPSELFGFQGNTDTFVIESQPATLNNVVHMAKKASVAPAFYSYRLLSNTTEPVLGINPGQMVFSAGSSIQNPNSIIISGNDLYGNGLQGGSETMNCPGSILKLFRKNFDGSIVLCRIYQFDKFQQYGSGAKVRFTDLTLKHQATAGTPTVPSPGTMEAQAQYLLSYQFSFSPTIYTVDEEGDPHYGDHRLEDVGHPVAATDAATKGYVDSVTSGGSDLPVYKFADKQMEELQAGQFCSFDSNGNVTTSIGSIRSIMWKGVDQSGNRPMRDTDAVDYEGNLNSTFSMLISNGTKLIMRAAMSQVVNGHPKLGYNSILDVYYLEWTGGDTTTTTSNFTRFTNGQSVTFHCPELFF